MRKEHDVRNSSPLSSAAILTISRVLWGRLGMTTVYSVRKLKYVRWSATGLITRSGSVCERLRQSITLSLAHQEEPCSRRAEDDGLLGERMRLSCGKGEQSYVQGMSGVLCLSARDFLSGFFLWTSVIFFSEKRRQKTRTPSALR